MKSQKEKTYCSYCFRLDWCHMSNLHKIIGDHSDNCSSKEKNIEFQSAICNNCIKRLYEQ